MENIIEKEVINISENKIESQEDRIDVFMIRFYHLKNKEMQKKIKIRKTWLAFSFAFNLLSLVLIAVTNVIDSRTRRTTPLSLCRHFVPYS